MAHIKILNSLTTKELPWYFTREVLTQPTNLAPLAMRQATIILMAIAFASAMAIASSLPVASGPPLRRSRFLAGNGRGNGPGNGNGNGQGPKDKKCTIDPTTCYAQGNPGSECCGDSCVNLQTDPLNCGHCGKMCKFTDSCCDGKCVDLNYNPKNCGACNNVCAKGTTCYYGMCNYA